MSNDKMILPEDPQERKSMPITTGVIDYFPRALAYVATVSKAGNDQHNPGKPLHWDKTKSLDHADCIPRHLIDRYSLDTDGLLHAGKLAWRALALLETHLEQQEAPAQTDPDDEGWIRIADKHPEKWENVRLRIDDAEVFPLDTTSPGSDEIWYSGGMFNNVDSMWMDDESGGLWDLHQEGIKVEWRPL